MTGLRANSPCERCCKCGASIPYAQGVVIGVCTPCWNAAAEAVASEDKDQPR